MKRPVVDEDLCTGCGSCAELCPEVFQLSDDAGKAHVLAADKCGSCDCEEAIAVCPVEAITWSEH